ncbi:MAG: ATPase domain-containing protein [Candidatus Aenigmatarchaeota archaeon]
MPVERIKTGIQKLDKLMEGGYPKGSTVLVSGGPGTGKTTFCLQYIYSGALNNEPGLYVSFENSPSELKESVKQLGMDFERLEKEGKVVILRIKETKDITELLKIIETEAKKINAKRLVIDSLSSIEIFASTFQSIIKDIPSWAIMKKISLMPGQESIVRRTLYKTIDSFKDMGLTTLLTSESQDTIYSRYGIAEFIVDGIIKLEAESVGKHMQRNILIAKMRKTKIDGGRHSIDITAKGIVLLD